MTSVESSNMTFIESIIDDWKVMAYNEARFDCICIIQDVCELRGEGKIEESQVVLEILTRIGKLRREFLDRSIEVPESLSEKS